jgi:hypothetical protein
LKHRDVAVRVDSDHGRIELPPVLKVHDDARRTLHHVGVRDDRSVRGPDEARSERLRAIGAIPSEEAEEWIHFATPDGRLGLDVHHGRQDVVHGDDYRGPSLGAHRGRNDHFLVALNSGGRDFVGALAAAQESGDGKGEELFFTAAGHPRNLSHEIPDYTCAKCA